MGNRIHPWSENPQSVLDEAFSRSCPPSSSPKKPNFEKAAVSALKIKDPSKALQVLTSAPHSRPFSTFTLVPPPPAPLPPPSSRPLFFQEDLIKAALLP